MNKNEANIIVNWGSKRYLLEGVDRDLTIKDLTDFWEDFSKTQVGQVLFHLPLDLPLNQPFDVNEITIIPKKALPRKKFKIKVSKLS